MAVSSKKFWLREKWKVAPNFKWCPHVRRRIRTLLNPSYPKVMGWQTYYDFVHLVPQFALAVTNCQFSFAFSRYTVQSSSALLPISLFPTSRQRMSERSSDELASGQIVPNTASPIPRRKVGSRKNKGALYLLTDEKPLVHRAERREKEQFPQIVGSVPYRIIWNKTRYKPKGSKLVRARGE